MKKILIFLALMFFYHKNFSQQVDSIKKFSLTGKFDDRDTGIICLYYIDKNGISIRDTSYLKNGTFYFSGEIKEPTEAALAGNIGSLKLEDPNFVQIYLEPSSLNVTLNQNQFKRIQMSGSKTQNELIALESLKSDLINEFNIQYTKLLKIQRVLVERGSNKNEEAYKLKKAKSNLKLIQDKLKNIDLKFIVNNPYSYLSLDLLYYYFSLKELTLDSAKKIFEKIDTNLKESYIAKKITTSFKSRENNLNGNTAFQFTKVNSNNKIIKLSSFKSRNFVLLDFWASWCTPCFKINPEIKKIFRKYKLKGLIIMGISLDNDKQKWKSSLNKYNESRWLNFLDSQGPDANIRSKYDISSIPELVLIDKNGKIIGRYLGMENSSNIADLKITLKSLMR